jgi:outer membrane murein-binding lipoprotein Lpp
MQAPQFKPGEIVLCPKCGQKGKVVIHTVRKEGGRQYSYLAVQHDTLYAGKKSTRKCVLGPLTPRPKPEELLSRVRELEAELQRLREENERLRRQLEAQAQAQAQAAQAERVKAALAYLLNSRIASVGERERQALYLAAVARPSEKALPSWAKRLNVSVEEVKDLLEQGKRLLDVLVHNEFIAVKPEAWAQVEQLVAGWRA